MLKILTIGDVVGTAAITHLRTHLWSVRSRLAADFVIANGENASDIHGLSHADAEALLDCGIDLLTMGNHTYNKREIVPYLEDCPQIIRPANYAPQAPGKGWAIFDSKAGPVAVIDLIGRCNMDYGPDNPFLMIEKILKEVDTKLIFVELHAEATSEKLAMGYMLDGRVSAVWGTHTHVPTSDAQVLPNGTGYVTDLGMTGPKHSVLGIRPDLSIAKFRGDLPERYRWAEGPTKMEAVLFTVDTGTGLCKTVERVDVYEDPAHR